METLPTFAALLVLSVFVEGIIEYFVSDPEEVQPWLKLASLFLGVVVCYFAQLDLFYSLGVVWAWPPFGYIATGMIVGRGSNYLNDFISKVRGV